MSSCHIHIEARESMFYTLHIYSELYAHRLVKRQQQQSVMFEMLYTGGHEQTRFVAYSSSTHATCHAICPYAML